MEILNTRDVTQKPAKALLSLSGAPWVESPDQEQISAALLCSAPGFIQHSVWNIKYGFEPGKNCVSGGYFKKYPYLIINIPDRRIITPPGFASFDPENKWRLENRAFLFNLIEQILSSPSGVLTVKSDGGDNIHTFPEMLEDWCVIQLDRKLFSVESFRCDFKTYFNGVNFYSTSGLLFIPFAVWKELPNVCEITAAFENPPAFFDLADQSEGKFCIKKLRQGMFSPDVVCAAAAEEQGFAVFLQDAKIIAVEPLEHGCLYVLDNDQSVSAPYRHIQKSVGDTVRKWEIAGNVAKAIWNKSPESVTYKWWRQSRYISLGVWLYPCTGFNLAVPDATEKIESYEAHGGLSCRFPLIGNVNEQNLFFAAAADAEARTGNRLADYLNFTAAGQHVYRNLVDLFMEFAVGSRGVLFDIDYSKVDYERFFKFIKDHAQAWRVYASPPPENLR